MRLTYPLGNGEHPSTLQLVEELIERLGPIVELGRRTSGEWSAVVLAHCDRRVVQLG